MADDLTLTPVYRFTFADGTTRRTDDPDAFEEVPHPDAVETLAMLGREDPECEKVELLGMAS